MNDALAPTLTPDEAPGIAWDAIVIGAGPAGCVCALVLARSGARVLLLDQRALPRPKVCGCCLGPAGVLALDALGASGALAGARALDHASLSALGGTIRSPLRGFVAIDRETLDARLAARARDAGAALLWPARARASADGAALIETGSGAVALRARLVIAADGLAGSSLREGAAPAWRIARGSRIGAGALLRDPPLPLGDAEVRMLWTHDGYLGLVRLPGGLVNAAAAWSPRAVREAGGLGAIAARALERAGADPSGALGARWTGVPTLTRRRTRLEHGAVRIVGDAAGYVEPFTGEGMSWAIASGARAGERGAAMLRAAGGGVSRRSGRADAPRWRPRICAGVALALRSETCVRAVMRAGGAMPGALDRAGPFLLGAPRFGASVRPAGAR